MTTARTTKDLIAEAQATEAALIALWDEMKATLTSPDAVTQKLADGGEALARGAQAAAKTATSSVKSHPFAAAALAAGAAWLLLRATDNPAKPAAEAVTAQAAEAWKNRAMVARDRAQKRLAETYTALRAESAQTAEEVADAGAARLSEASDLARQKATITADLARDLSEAFHHGLSSLGAEPKDHILKAREHGFAAVLNTPESEASYWQKGQALARRNPLPAAALGLAAGVGVAWMMPRTRAAIRAAAPGAIGAVVTPATALVAQNLMARAARLMDPFVPGDKSEAAANKQSAPEPKPDPKPDPKPETQAPVSQTVKDAAKAAAVAGVAKAVGEAIGKAGAKRAAKSAKSAASLVQDGTNDTGQVADALAEKQAAHRHESGPKGTAKS